MAISLLFPHPFLCNWIRQLNLAARVFFMLLFSIHKDSLQQVSMGLLVPMVEVHTLTLQPWSFGVVKSGFWCLMWTIGILQKDEDEPRHRHLSLHCYFFSLSFFLSLQTANWPTSHGYSVSQLWLIVPINVPMQVLLLRTPKQLFDCNNLSCFTGEYEISEVKV